MKCKCLIIKKTNIMKKVIVLSSLLLGVVFLAGCGKQQTTKTQPAVPTPAIQTQVTTTQPAPTTTTENITPEKVIFDLIGQKKDSKITIDKSTDSYIRADIFNNPGGYLVFAKKVNGKWTKVFEGQDCSKKDLIANGFPQDMLTNCF